MRRWQPASPSAPTRAVSITFSPMGPTPEPPPPERLLTPAKMTDLADRLKDAIAAIERWGMNLHPMSRLNETECLLREVASIGSFPDSHDDLLRVAHAARDAQEFSEIAGMLPGEPLHPAAIALRKATKGKLFQTGGAPYQFQSELWVGALLSCAVDFLGVPLSQGQPDYIVKNGNMKYGVEVKRPQREDSILTRAAKGVKQLEVPSQHYHGGALVMDLTDCVGSGLASTLDSGPPILDPVQNWIALRMQELHRYVYDDAAGRIRKGRHHIFSVTVVVRLVHWDLGDLSQMYLTRYIGCLVYPKSPKSLRGLRADWLAGLFHRGAQAAGYHDLGGHRVNFHHPSR